MTRSAGNSRAPLSAWVAETLRLTTFHAPSQVSQDGWWKALTGNDPDSTVTKPKLGLRADVGRYVDAMLALQIQVQPTENRVDWITTIPSETESEPATITLLPERIRHFRELMIRWLPTAPAITRLAFGAVLMMRVVDEPDGHRALSNYLNFDIDPGVASDFLYQANRRRQSIVVENLAVNRLTKWSVGKYKLHTIAITVQGAAFQPTEDQEYCSCRLELDINTEVRSNPLPADRIVNLWCDLVGQGLGIVTDGDVS